MQGKSRLTRSLRRHRDRHRHWLDISYICRALFWDAAMKYGVLYEGRLGNIREDSPDRGGVASISRGLSEATPPVGTRPSPYDPGRVAAPLDSGRASTCQPKPGSMAPLPGCGPARRVNRGYRPGVAGSQPPANRCHPCRGGVTTAIAVDPQLSDARFPTNSNSRTHIEQALA